MFEKQCLDRILGLICSVFDAYSAVLFLPDGENGYRLAAHFSLGDNVIPDSTVGQAPGGIIGWIAKHRQPLLVSNFDQTRGHLGYYNPKAGEEATIKAFMGCPLASGAGVLGLDSKKTHSFTIKDQKLLHQFVQLVEVVHANTGSDDLLKIEHVFYRSMQFILELHHRFPKWSVFLKHFLDVVAQTSGFSHACLAARDEIGKTYFLEGWNRQIFIGGMDQDLVFPIGGGMVGWVFKSGAPVFNCDLDRALSSKVLLGMNLKIEEFRSVICLPLFVHRRTRGVLVLADPSNLSPTEEMKIFLQMVTEHLALFLENLYLKTRLTEYKIGISPLSQE